MHNLSENDEHKMQRILCDAVTLKTIYYSSNLLTYLLT